MILLSKESIKRIIKINKGKSYTYGLCRNSGELFYVGVGKLNRVFKHELEQRNNSKSNLHKLNIIAKESQLKYVLFLVSSNREDCLKMEAAIISKFGRIDIDTGTLTNLTDGGEAGPNGHKYSEERLEKQIERIHGYADRIADTLKKRYESLSKEEQQEICNRLDGHRNNEKALAKLSVKSRERWADPEYRRKLSEKLREVNLRNSEVHSKNMKAMWADPEYREKMLEARRIAKEKRLVEKESTNSNVVKNLNKE